MAEHRNATDVNVAFEAVNIKAASTKAWDCGSVNARLAVRSEHELTGDTHMTLQENRNDGQPNASNPLSSDRPLQQAQADEPELLNNSETPDADDTLLADADDSGDFA
jgi:hypothetical protein